MDGWTTAIGLLDALLLGAGFVHGWSDAGLGSVWEDVKATFQTGGLVALAALLLGVALLAVGALVALLGGPSDLADTGYSIASVPHAAKRVTGIDNTDLAMGALFLIIAVPFFVGSLAGRLAARVGGD